MLRGESERADGVIEFEEGTRPAMGHQERPLAFSFTHNVQEVDIEPVNLRLEVRVAVKLSFGRPPVIAVQPVRLDILHHIG